VRREIKRQLESYVLECIAPIDDIDSGIIAGFRISIDICNDCLDIATLGEIE
jgi:hypothetical protein